MKEIDLNALIQNDAEYDRRCMSVSEKYRCNWDDAIHDSYARYTRELCDYARDMHAIRCRAETLAAEVDALRVDEMRSEAERLCREANDI